MLARTPGFDLALLQKSDGLLIEYFFSTGVLTALGAFVLVITVSSITMRLHVKARPKVTKVQHSGKSQIT